MHQLFNKLLSLVWFYNFFTNLGGRLRSIFFHLVFPSFFEVEGGIDEIGIVSIVESTRIQNDLGRLEGCSEINKMKSKA